MYGLDVATLRSSLWSAEGLLMAGLMDNTTASEAAAAASSDDNAVHTPNLFAQAGLLGLFVPQYTLLASATHDALGLDIGLVVAACLVAYSLLASTQHLWLAARSLVGRHYTASIAIRSDDEIYHHVKAWLAGGPLATHNSRLTAETDYEATPPADEEPETTADGFVNFAGWRRRSEPRFVPAHGQHWFRHRGRFFQLSRLRQRAEDTSSRDEQEETLAISCLGRSAQHIKALLADCKDAYYDKKVTCTNISRPSRSGGRNWDLVASRRSRPIETVVLDGAQKRSLLADMDEFLRPSTAAWYAERGIPYRRGYLFHGPPGTGKTSLSFAAAGLFGLDVFCLSLMDPSTNEEDLLGLFAQLPSRCIVLLEDVDTAGLVKREGVGSEDSGAASESDFDSSSRATGAGAATRNHRRSGITLSGLLNVIDGMASHEGRILVLTTNKPGALDPALRRPGRVDREVAFRNADRSQIVDLFGRMYAGSGSDAIATATLIELARSFAAELEDGVWSPAEIQGFLLAHKGDPRAAVEQVGVWRDEQLWRKDRRNLRKRSRVERKEKETQEHRR